MSQPAPSRTSQMTWSNTVTLHRKGRNREGQSLAQGQWQSLNRTPVSRSPPLELSCPSIFFQVITFPFSLQ